MRRQEEAWTIQYVRKKRRNQLWQRIVGGLACVVVFCTTYALILPAITQEKTAFCGYEEHVHTDACYASVTGPPGSDDATQPTQVLEPICGLAEVSAHTHTTECFAPAHTHTKDCYGQPELVCGQEEGSVHIHDENCYGEEKQTLICPLEETLGHTHDEHCYDEDGQHLVCGMEECERHAHTPDCFTTERELICTCSDTQVHQHTDDCYAAAPLICGLEEREAEELVCGQEQTQGHTHSTACYPFSEEETAEPMQSEPVQSQSQEQELICGKQEHTHDLSCYSDRTADVETASIWEKTLPGNLTGVWREDVLSVATSQLGYEESTRNYLVDGGQIYGYSRYGDWYGDPYGDWCAMFVSFCLHYAGVEQMPLSSGCQRWIADLREENRYRAEADYQPQPGDLVFFDLNRDGTSDHVGLVESVHTEQEQMQARITTIEGNSGDRVQRVTYSRTDSRIIGFATLPEQLSAEERAAVDALIARIAALPTVEEIDEQLSAYEEAEDLEQMELWYSQLLSEISAAKAEYDSMSQLQQEAVTGAEKLLNLAELSGATAWNEGFAFDTPTVAQSASTKDFIDLNLYDYNGHINNNTYDQDKKYPGFQWNGGAYIKVDDPYDRHEVDYIDFGNSNITDRSYGQSSTSVANGKSENAVIAGVLYSNNSAKNTGAINWLWRNGKDNSTITNRPVGMSTGLDVLSRKLQNGYPALSDNTSLAYLFKDDNWAVFKQNTESIDGLFQYDEKTGAYYFNSRWNHAQYSDNKFTLYNQIITPNFIVYPFGNFLPFNTITDSTKATQVSSINGNSGSTVSDYAQKIRNDLTGKTDYSKSPTSQQLNSMLERYQNDIKNTDIKSAQSAIVDYLTGGSGSSGDKPTSDSGLITDALLEKMYNIDWDEETNFFFGMDMTMNFMQPKDGLTGPDGKQKMVFYFTGDDDVWVYIDGVLFLDLTGIHRHVGGEIDFVNGKVHYYELDVKNGGDVSSTPYRTYTFKELLEAAGMSTDTLNEKGTFKDYSIHNFKFFYMERGSGSSVCRMNFNFPLLRQNSISVLKQVSADEEILGNPSYPFQVLKANDSGKTDELFIAANTPYTLYDADESIIQEVQVTKDYAGRTTNYRVVDQNGNDIPDNQILKTDANGVFYLKAGQKAEFVGIDENAGKYYVRELLDETVLGQYGNVTVSGQATTTQENVTIGSATFTGKDSPIKDMSDGATAFRFTNAVDSEKLGQLRISKVLAEYTKERAAKTFDIALTLDGVALPVGTTYQVGDETRTVEESGIITIAAGEEAVISNILAGTSFTVQETSGSAEGYTVSYSESGDSTITVEGDMAKGIITTAAKVELIVTNAEKGTDLLISGTKSQPYYDGVERSYTMRLTEVTDETGTTAKPGGIDNYTAQVTVAEKEESFQFKLTYVQAQLDELPKTCYYRITEDAPSDHSFLKNDTVYVVQVTISETENGEITAEISKMWKNGTEVSDRTASFVNTITGDLTLSKIVDGGSQAQQTGRFQFTVTLNLGTSGLSALPDSYLAERQDSAGETKTETLTLIEGKLTIELQHGETVTIHGIPVGAYWKIEETRAEGYIVRTAVTVGEETTSGDTAVTEGNLTAGGVNVVYTNQQTYELPKTGGIGTQWYSLAGFVLVLTALCLLGMKKRRGKGVT